MKRSWARGRPARSAEVRAVWALRLPSPGEPSALPDGLRCCEVTDALVDYLDGDLPPQTRAAVDDHLACCDGCVGYTCDYQRTVHLVRAARRRD